MKTYYIVYKLDYLQNFFYSSESEGEIRPDLKTPLFHAPLPNVYNDGKVCMGNVKKPGSTIEISDLISSWQKAFWGSEFTNHLYDELKKQYPSKLLLPHKKTLNTLLK